MTEAYKLRYDPMAVSDSAIYSKPVAEICLQCPYSGCLSPDKGCERYQTQYRAFRNPRRRGWAPLMKKER